MSAYVLLLLIIDLPTTLSAVRAQVNEEIFIDK